MNIVGAEGQFLVIERAGLGETIVPYDEDLLNIKVQAFGYSA